MMASISSRERKPTIGRSKRFMGTPKACSTTCSAVTSRRPANFRNARSAASRALRLRTELRDSVVGAHDMDIGEVFEAVYADITPTLAAQREELLAELAKEA